MFGLVMLFLIIAGYASLIKICARLLKESIVSWKNSFIFSAMIVAISMIFRIIVLSNTIKISTVIAAVSGFVLQLTLGAWFFRNRATDIAGNALGWRGGIKVMTMFYVVLGSLLIFLFCFLYFLKSTIIH